jgi:hypothetical protein
MSNGIPLIMPDTAIETPPIKKYGIEQSVPKASPKVPEIIAQKNGERWSLNSMVISMRTVHTYR